VYTVDHLLDSLKRKEKSSSLRYRIHFKYRVLLITVIFLFSVFVLYAVFTNFLKDGIIASIVLGFLLMFYFLLVLLNRKKSKILQKEFFVAFFYTLGIWGFPMVFSHELIPIWYFLMMFSFFLISASVLMNYSIVDIKTDLADNQNSLVVIFGVKKTISLMHIISGINFLLLILTVCFFPERNVISLIIILLVMIGANLVLFLLRKKMEVLSWYKIFGELVFFLPILYLLLYY